MEGKPLKNDAERLPRPRVASLDEILGVPFEVLDDGLVRVVDYMGDDAAVVQAARVSYGKGTKKSSDDRGLIRYLLRHRHTTPFEMCSIKLHVRVPMDAWRQWIRHRTACLAEGTEIYFDLPGGVSRRGNQLYKLKIEDIWEKFQPTRNAQRPDKQKNPYFKRNRIKGMHLRHLNENSGMLAHTKIVNVFKNGPKPVFRFTLADGKSIEATADHKFLFAGGWSTFKAEVGLEERNGKAVWNQGGHYLHVNGLALEKPATYMDKEWLDHHYNEQEWKIQDIADECGVSYSTIRKWIRVHGIQHEKGGRSKEPWNKGKTYRNGQMNVTPEHRSAIRKARSGPASNFWEGGVSTERQGIGRWTTQIAAKIHEKNSWTCQLCHERSRELHCHHIVPVWAEPDLAREESNLTTLCADCHTSMHGHELEFVEDLGGPPVKKEWAKRPRVAWNKLTTTRLVKVVDIEFMGIKETYDLEVEGPHHNFIANGIVTHNSVNETSTRYSIAIEGTQKTAPDQWRLQSSNNKMGSSGLLDEVEGAELTRRETEFHDSARALYDERLELGIAREQARKDLPLCTYTEAYWKMDLHNLLHFLALRMDPHAQLEIREYANVIGREIVARWVPLVWEAFEDYRLGASYFSRIETELMAAIAGGDPAGAERIARANGWLKESKKGGWIRHRERMEFEAKLAALNLAVPW
jgi:thymidylate synthase (FAD)